MARLTCGRIILLLLNHPLPLSSCLSSQISGRGIGGTKRKHDHL